MATASNPIKFFDIASGPPARYALNAKGVDYTTEWVDLADVKSTRQAHSVAPVRKLPDNGDFYTLPFIHDPSSSTYVGDSFDIAVYLDTRYASSGGGGVRLFPPDPIGLHRAFNAQVDALFSRHVALAGEFMPLNPATAEESKAEFARRMGLRSWDEIRVKPEAREGLLKAFEADLDEFAKLWRFDAQGPFLEGAKMSYADLFVGGWLGMMKETLPEWERFCQWQGGRWKRLHDALAPYAEIK